MKNITASLDDATHRHARMLEMITDPLDASCYHLFPRLGMQGYQPLGPDCFFVSRAGTSPREAISLTRTTKPIGGRNGRIRVGAGGVAVRGSAAVARRRPLCRRHGIAADGIWPRAAFAPRTCSDPLDRYDRSEGR